MRESAGGMSTFGDSKNLYSTLLTDCHLEGLKQELYLRERIVIFIQRTELWNRIKQYSLEFHERFVQAGCNPDLLLGPLIVTLEIDYGALKKFGRFAFRIILENTYHVNIAFLFRQRRPGKLHPGTDLLREGIPRGDTEHCKFLLRATGAVV